MLKCLLRLWLAVFLILAASAVLLLSDRQRPRGRVGSSGPGSESPGRVRSIALFQHVSQATMEEGVRGVLAGLAESGYRDGSTIRVRRYNAEGDAATSNTIAREIIGGDNDLVITLSTPSLQAMAGANRDAKLLHVFGMVIDPVAAGVGISRDDPAKHLPYMVGLATMPPVAETFRIARRLAPRLARVGVPWNPSESNSEAGTKIARTICKELGIELLEANVDGSGAVREAVASLSARGAEAIWVGGDNTVLSSLDAVIAPARSAGVPVFTSIPGCAARGLCSTSGRITTGSASRSAGWPDECWPASPPPTYRSSTRSRPSSGSTGSRSNRKPGAGPSPRRSTPRLTWWSKRGARSGATRVRMSTRGQQVRQGRRGPGRWVWPRSASRSSWMS